MNVVVVFSYKPINCIQNLFGALQLYSSKYPFCFQKCHLFDLKSTCYTSYCFLFFLKRIDIKMKPEMSIGCHCKTTIKKPLSFLNGLRLR